MPTFRRSIRLREHSARTAWRSPSSPAYTSHRTIQTSRESRGAAAGDRRRPRGAPTVAAPISAVLPVDPDAVAALVGLCERSRASPSRVRVRIDRACSAPRAPATTTQYLQSPSTLKTCHVVPANARDVHARPDAVSRRPHPRDGAGETFDSATTESEYPPSHRRTTRSRIRPQRLRVQPVPVEKIARCRTM